MSASARSFPWGWMLLTCTLENWLQKPENRARGNSAWNDGLVSWWAAARFPGRNAKKACVADAGSPAGAPTSAVGAGCRDGAGDSAVVVSSAGELVVASSVCCVSEAGGDDDVAD